MTNRLPQEGDQGKVRYHLPDPKVFVDQKDMRDVVMPERQTVFNGARVFIFDHAEYPESGGIERHFVGCLHPDNHFPFPQAGFANEHVKKNLRGLMKMFDGNKLMALSAVWTKKALENTLRPVIEQADHAFAQVYYMGEYPRYYSKPAKELKKFSDAFFTALGMPEDIVFGMGRLIMTVFEHDNAYMCRLQDLAMEAIVSSLLKDFPVEVARLMKIFAERDPVSANVEKFQRFEKMLALCWRFPRFKKALRAGIVAVDWENLGMSEAEYYHHSMRSDYAVWGIPFPQRLQSFIAWHKKLGKPEPLMMEIQK